VRKHVLLYSSLVSTMYIFHIIFPLMVVYMFSIYRKNMKENEDEEALTEEETPTPPEDIRASEHVGCGCFTKKNRDSSSKYKINATE